MNRLTLLVLALTVLATSNVYAVPSQITVQGRLTDAVGTPLSAGPKTFTFRIFNASAGGLQIWPGGGGEVQSITSGADGLWIGLLGAVDPLSDLVFADSVRWLEIDVNGTILPRVRLLTGPYAYRVSTVDGASGGTITSKVSIGPGHTNTGNHAFVAGTGNQVLGNFSAVGGGSINNATGESSVISGGQQQEATGFASAIGGGADNTASGDWSTAGGGLGNMSSAARAVVDGGGYNIASEEGAVVGGGGYNRARGSYSVVAGGGGANPADSNSAPASVSTISGGYRNVANGQGSAIGGGFSNTANEAWSVISGGIGNVAAASGNVGGGQQNNAGLIATVGGGRFNTALGFVATVGGGQDNTASGLVATIAGGQDNAATGSRTMVGGGQLNSATADYATIGGGYSNNASGLNATIAGGGNNVASGSGGGATIGGGVGNVASGQLTTVAGGNVNTASVLGGTVGGGLANSADDTASTVAGGKNNKARGRFATVSGGGGATPADSNSAVGPWSFVGGGKMNTAEWAAAVAGGESNSAEGAWTTIGGGFDNRAVGFYATVPGGFENVALSNGCFAAGARAKSTHAGTFVWSNGATFVSTGPDQFLISAPGGVGVGTNAPQQLLSVAAGMNIDQNNANTGFENSLRFGSFTGEAIASKRTPGGNQYGMDFWTNNLNRMSITNAGNVGIGTDSPGKALQIGDETSNGSEGMIRLESRTSTGGAELRIWEIGVPQTGPTVTGKGYDFVIDDAQLGADPEAVFQYGSGHLGLGVLDPVFRIELPNVASFSGQGRANAWLTYSSRRWKENIKTIENALVKVEKLRGVEYDQKSDGAHTIGLIAEEVGQVIPEVVQYERNGTDAMALDYARLVPLLIEGMKEQQQQIEKQQDQINQLIKKLEQ